MLFSTFTIPFWRKKQENKYFNDEKPEIFVPFAKINLPYFIICTYSYDNTINLYCKYLTKPEKQGKM